MSQLSIFDIKTEGEPSVSRYCEIILIQRVKDRKTRIKLYLEFITEYAGWVQHLKEIGTGWGANGEAAGAGKELKIAVKHLEKLKRKIIEELND